MRIQSFRTVLGQLAAGGGGGGGGLPEWGSLSRLASFL